mgnify:CR=1 FL=1
MIYLDNAATTLQKPPCVGQAMLDALEHAGTTSHSFTAAELIERYAENFGAEPHLARLAQTA